jgi:hypothetical protein
MGASAGLKFQHSAGGGFKFHQNTGLLLRSAGGGLNFAFVCGCGVEFSTPLVSTADKSVAQSIAKNIYLSEHHVGISMVVYLKK